MNKTIMAFVILFSGTVWAAPQVKSVKAKLFNYQTGEFSEDILKSQNFGNVVTFASGLLMVAEVAVEAGNQAVELVLVNPKKPTKKLGHETYANSFGRNFFPIFTTSVGCTPLELRIYVKESGKERLLKTESVPFVCHE